EGLFRFAELRAQVRPLLRIRAVVLRPLEAIHLGMQRARALGDRRTELGGLRLQVDIAQVLEARFVLVNRIHAGLNALQLAVEPRPENFRKPAIGHCPSSDTARVPRCTRAPGRALNIEWNAPV